MRANFNIIMLLLFPRDDKAAGSLLSPSSLYDKLWSRRNWVTLKCWMNLLFRHGYRELRRSEVKWECARVRYILYSSTQARQISARRNEIFSLKSCFLECALCVCVRSLFGSERVSRSCTSTYLRRHLSLVGQWNSSGPLAWPTRSTTWSTQDDLPRNAPWYWYDLSDFGFGSIWQINALLLKLIYTRKTIYIQKT